MRLIDADAKLVALLYDDEHEEWIKKEMTVADYLSFADIAIPFVDAVPVVRCKYCRWRTGLEKDTAWHPCDEVAVNDNWYCAYRERKDDG